MAERLNKEHHASSRAVISSGAPEDSRKRLKICFIGDSEVGKTSLVRRFVSDAFVENYLPTIGAQITEKEVRIETGDSEDGEQVLLSIWDVMGRDWFRTLLLEAYFFEANGILAVCDMTRPETLEGLEKWRQSIKGVNGETPICVLGNKIDFEEEVELNSDDLQAFCERWECPYVLTSAKTGHGVEKAFQAIAKLVLRSEP